MSIEFILNKLGPDFHLSAYQAHKSYLVYRPLSYKLNNLIIDTLITQFMHVGLCVDGIVYHYWADDISDIINIYDNYIQTPISEFNAKYFIEVNSDGLKEKINVFLDALKKRDISLYNEIYSQNIEIFYDLFRSNCEVVANSLVLNKSETYQVEFIELMLYDGQDKRKIDPNSKLGLFLIGLNAATEVMLLRYPNNTILKQLKNFLN